MEHDQGGLGRHVPADPHHVSHQVDRREPHHAGALFPVGRRTSRTEQRIPVLDPGPLPAQGAELPPRTDRGQQRDGRQCRRRHWGQSGFRVRHHRLPGSGSGQCWTRGAGQHPGHRNGRSNPGRLDGTGGRRTDLRHAGQQDSGCGEIYPAGEHDGCIGAHHPGLVCGETGHDVFKIHEFHGDTGPEPGRHAQRPGGDADQDLLRLCFGIDSVDPVVAGFPVDCRFHKSRLSRTGFLPAGTLRAQRQAIHALQIPDHGGRRGGEAPRAGNPERNGRAGVQDQKGSPNHSVCRNVPEKDQPG